MKTLVKELLIIRGANGSGKSYLAQELAKSEKAFVFSTDDWLVNGKGEYEWSEDRGLMAHHANQKAAIKAMREGLTPIIIDNLNLRPLVASPYVKAGRFYNYRWDAVEPDTPWARDANELFRRNKHNVSLKVIEDRLHSLKIFPLHEFKRVLNWEHTMDPEVTLLNAQRQVESGDLFDADYSLLDYRNWRQHGGYEPDAGDDVATSLERKIIKWRNAVYIGPIGGA